MSQYGEHEVILKHFAGRDPAAHRFLDIGAFDGVTNSNTRPLADLGWSGVLVEPCPPAFCLLMRNYEANERMTLVNAAIVAYSPRLQVFHVNSANGDYCDQVSTFSEDHRAKWGAHPFRPILIHGVTWFDLLEACDTEHASFDFVNIDVEGTNLEVFRALPFLPEMVCVELDPHVAVLEAVQNRYLNTQVIGGNVLGWNARPAPEDTWCRVRPVRLVKAVAP